MNSPLLKLEPYSEGDFALLARNNSPEMTQYIGGPESAEQLKRRHQRYLAPPQPGKAQMLKLVLLPGLEAVGIIGYWEIAWQNELVWEAGWGVLPEYQGRGIGKTALAALVIRARQEKLYRFLHAFPSVANLPSNAICQKVGFDLIGACDFEYPKGHFMRCNDWRFDLVERDG